ncbi:NADP-dependent leukotriene B4 12-hydroxydehydrogenase [Delitschia confertaspora ATCC 74209]|uniref:NADP-dependent leukotriene B4 12-hydroxydehydrogenase n=1 Tax=Delitschia confertaspora ATCC 74209 TaxID=1513339 RepID=A0A9P4JW12_9PLEO|nr:NADP-dependent leukotriene B4 12-hydroxydehydrogenase [Delitschia confertaspora ATCC 74209]
MVQNKGVIFRNIPNGWPVKGKDLTIEDRPLDLDNTNPPEGGIIVKNYYVSFDPYQRGRMRPANVKSYSPPFELNKPITNRAISKVVKSDTSKFQPGDVITTQGLTPIEEYSVLDKDFVKSAYKLENPYNLDPKVFLGALGMPGLTAWSSFYEIGQPKKGETIFISAASGAVGQLVGQLAKHEGLKVIGSVGDDKKLDFILKELKFDEGFNYKKEKPGDALKRLAPNGIDIYYENVGGEHLEAAIDSMNNFGRIVACGMISQYNLKPEEQYPIKNLMQVVAKRIKMQGFIVSDENMGPKHYKDHQEKLQKWISEGTFKAQMSVTEGIDNAIDGLLGMFEGKNFGKAVLQIADLEKE